MRLIFPFDLRMALSLRQHRPSFVAVSDRLSIIGGLVWKNRSPPGVWSGSVRSNTICRHGPESAFMLKTSRPLSAPARWGVAPSTVQSWVLALVCC